MHICAHGGVRFKLITAFSPKTLMSMAETDMAVARIVNKVAILPFIVLVTASEELELW
jgi:uncharacterized protein YqhQ